MKPIFREFIRIQFANGVEMVIYRVVVVFLHKLEPCVNLKEKHLYVLVRPELSDVIFT